MRQRFAHLRDETLKRAFNLAGELIDQALANISNDEIKKQNGEI